MLPQEFIKRIETQEYIDKESLLMALEEPSPVSIRTNPLKWSKKPPDSEPVEWCKTGFYLGKRPSYTLDPIFHSGCYYPQEASSMFLEQVIQQSAGEAVNLKVLDLCAAPGGKSTHLSSLIGPGSFLVANEVIKSRVPVLVENVTKWGSSNTIITQNDPVDFVNLKGFFDIILVDAPCSGEGMFRGHVAVREWSKENSNLCASRQKRILSDIWPALKENGILIYSTCTFNPAENEQNIRWLLDRYAAETIKINLTGFKGIKEIDFKGISGYGFHPGKIRGDGFFISAIRKKEKQESRQLKNQKSGNLKLSKIDAEIAGSWTSFKDENLIRTGNDIIMIPVDLSSYQYLSKNLRIVKSGTRICTVKKNDFLPAHELALSSGLKPNAFPVAELDYDQAISYLRRDNLKIQNIGSGWFIPTYHGVNLGFANNLTNRINNYYPVEWRIRMSIPESAKQEITGWI